MDNESKYNSDEEEYEEIPEADKYFIPKSESVTLRHGQKMITSTSIESTGNRLITANKDCTMNLWDFNGMNSSASSFKTVTPCEQELKNIEFSANGEHILVCCNDIQAFILDREGERVLETIKGNPYLFDPRSTKGHNKMLNFGCWNPRVAEEMLTCSGDGSLRIWNILDYEKILSERRIKNHKSCIVPKSNKGKKLIPVTCTYSNSGLFVAAGCTDGSLQMWDTRKSFTKSDLQCPTAHPDGCNISSVKFSYDDNHVLTRASDDTMKIFDVRTGLKSPMKVFSDLYLTNERTNCIFSPNDKIITTGTSLRKNDTESYVVFYSRDTFEELDRITVNNASTVTVEWHPRLNQFLVGTTAGTLDLYFDRTFSHNGALLFSGKTPKQKKSTREFYTNDMLLTYDEETERLARIGQRASKFREGSELNPYLKAKKEIKKRVPQQPTEANNKYPTLHQHLVQQIVIPKRTKEAEYYENNPREAILRHANAPKYWTAGAYDKTQPKPIFDNEEDEPETKRPKMI